MGVSDDLKIVSGEVMPADPLRERLKKLVEELRPPLDPDESKNDSYWLGWDDALTEVLTALLAESEPVDWSQPQELVITADGPLEPEPPCSCKSR